jgi:heme-degrading monooxygenase HmoA
MIHRIVKMEFHPGKTNEFLEIFEKAQMYIQNTPGCQDLKLLRDIHNENIFFTLSIWEDESALNDYKSSDFFSGTWSKTKELFANKPLAWSTKTT